MATILTLDSLPAADKSLIESSVQKHKDEVPKVYKIQVDPTGVLDAKTLRKTKSKNKNDSVINSETVFAVVGNYRLYMFMSNTENKKDKSQLKLCKETHWLDITHLENVLPGQFGIKGKEFSVHGDTPDTDNFLSDIYFAIVKAFPTLKDKIVFNFFDDAKIAQLTQGAAKLLEQAKCGGYVRTYEAVCDYYGIAASTEISWDVDNLLHFNDVNEFNLSDFKGVRLGVSDYKAMLLSLQYNNYFNSLVLNYKPENKDVLTYVTDLLQTNESISSLTMRNVGATKDTCAQLKTAFQFNPNLSLTSLDLSGNQIEDKGIIAIAESLDAFTKNRKLISMDLSNCGVSHSGIIALSQALEDNIAICQSLESLSLSGNSIGSKASTPLGNFLEKSKSLKELHLSDTKCIFNALKKCDYLTTLNISNNAKSLNTKENTHFDLYLFLSHSTQLKNLIITNCGLTSEALNIILNYDHEKNHLPFLETVDISDNGSTFGDQGLIDSLDTLKKRIHFGELKHLYLNRNFETKGRNTLRAKSIEVLCDLVKPRQDGSRYIGLQSLYISGGQKYTLKQDIIPFIYSLLTNQGLQVLDVSGNSSGDPLAIALGKVLQTNSTLVQLSWDENGISADGFGFFRNGIARNSTLKLLQPSSIDLSNCLKNEKTPGLIENINQIFETIYRNATYVEGSDVTTSSSGNISLPSSPVQQVTQDNSNLTAPTSPLKTQAAPQPTPARLTSTMMKQPGMINPQRKSVAFAIKGKDIDSTRASNIFSGGNLYESMLNEPEMNEEEKKQIRAQLHATKDDDSEDESSVATLSTSTRLSTVTSQQSYNSVASTFAHGSFLPQDDSDSLLKKRETMPPTYETVVDTNAKKPTDVKTESQPPEPKSEPKVEPKVEPKKSTPAPTPSSTKDSGVDDALKALEDSFAIIDSASKGTLRNTSSQATATTPSKQLDKRSTIDVTLLSLSCVLDDLAADLVEDQAAYNNSNTISTTTASSSKTQAVNSSNSTTTKSTPTLRQIPDVEEDNNTSAKVESQSKQPEPELETPKRSTSSGSMPSAAAESKQQPARPPPPSRASRAILPGETASPSTSSPAPNSSPSRPVPPNVTQKPLQSILKKTEPTSTTGGGTPNRPSRPTPPTLDRKPSTTTQSSPQRPPIPASPSNLNNKPGGGGSNAQAPPRASVKLPPGAKSIFLNAPPKPTYPPPRNNDTSTG